MYFVGNFNDIIYHKIMAMLFGVQEKAVVAVGDVTASTCWRFWLGLLRFFIAESVNDGTGAVLVEPKLPSLGGRTFPLEARLFRCFSPFFTPG